jgi:hypothetical protein
MLKMAWKRASTVFHGGTVEAEALFGKKVRARTSLGLYEYIEESRPFGKEIIIGTGTIGFVGHSKMDTIVLAFPNDQTRSYTNIEELRWGQFRSVVCNWGTFREQFDIDM